MTIQPRSGARRRFSAPALLALLLPVVVWAPLTYPGYFQFHSGFLPVFNLNAMLAHLADLGWAPLIGQSFDLLRGERALPYVMAALPALVGVAPQAAIKLVFGIGLVAGSAGIFAWSRRRLGDWPALLAAAVYITWPVALATTYVRGALAESSLLGLLPWVLWAGEEVVALPAGAGARIRVPRVALFALLVAGTLWTQAGLALWLCVLAAAYGLVSAASGDPAAHAGRAGSRVTTLSVLAGVGGGLALGALGLLPSVLRHGWGGSVHLSFIDHLVYPHQLLAPGWGAGPSVPGAYDTLTFSIGIAAFGLAVFSGLTAARMPAGARRRHAFALGALLVLLVLSTTLAAPFWRLLPGLARTLTYPWQLLLLAGPWLAWLAGQGGAGVAGVLAEPDRERHGVTVAAILMVVCFLAAYPDLRSEPAGIVPGDRPAAIFAGDEIALLDVKIEGAAVAGAQVALEAHWQALRPLERDYTVFFHIMGPDGKRYAQQDTMPVGGAMPTSRWRPGQVVHDRYEVTLAPDAPPGDYEIWLGWYLLDSGQRLQTGGEDKLVLALAP